MTDTAAGPTTSTGQPGGTVAGAGAPAPAPAGVAYRGLQDEAAADALLLELYRVVLTARAVDDRLWALSRQGQVNFVLTARGHEVAQAASALAMRAGLDSAWLYYRDMAVALALGVTPYEIFLGALARADDPHSGSRQLTMHLASPGLRIGTMSSAVAAQLPHAVGAAYFHPDIPVVEERKQRPKGRLIETE